MSRVNCCYRASKKRRWESEIRGGRTARPCQQNYGCSKSECCINAEEQTHFKTKFPSPKFGTGVRQRNMAEGYPIFYVSVQTVSIGFPPNLVLKGEEVCLAGESRLCCKCSALILMQMAHSCVFVEGCRQAHLSFLVQRGDMNFQLFRRKQDCSMHLA